MDENLSSSPPSSKLSPRLVLLIILIVSFTGVSSAIVWIYHRIQQSFGLEAAEVAVAFLAILVLGLILVGVRLGFSTKRALHKRHDYADRIYYRFNHSRTFQEFWLCLGLETQKLELPSEVSSLDDGGAGQQATAEEDELAWLLVMEEEIARRGRIPDHSIERWARVVYAWEHQNPWNRVSLTEFLCREFGAYVNGNPKVSKSNFYTWRKKIHRLAREYRKKIPSKTGIE